MYRVQSQRRWVFRLIMVGCVLFVVLTLIAMMFYPGGTVTDPTASGYSFFANVFSELGMTETYAGQPNTVSRVLFTIALSSTGAGLVAFFLAFRQFFVASYPGRILSGIGSVSGVICASCLVGAAFIPIDVQEQWHFSLVTAAFGAFAAAAVPYAAAIRREQDYPNHFALVFDAYGILLLLYLLLVMLGPPRRASEGMVLQATAQKIIVYSAVISVMVQSYGANRMLNTRHSESAGAWPDASGVSPGELTHLNASLVEGDGDATKD